jgi:hypothetical protein
MPGAHFPRLLQEMGSCTTGQPRPAEPMLGEAKGFD